MAEEELELDVTQSKGSKMTTILLIVVIVLLLIIGGVAGWYFLLKDDGGDSGSGAKETVALGPIQYFTMTPEFVVNFGPDSKVRYLQVDLQVSTRDEVALKALTTYRPVLRNDILVILSGLSFDELKSRGGKEALQTKLLNSINKVISLSIKSSVDGSNEDETGADTNSGTTKKKGPIENVYFTSFIMQ